MPSDYSSRARLFRDALFDAVGDESRHHDPLVALTSLIEQCRTTAIEDETAAGALDAFDAIAVRGNVEDAVSEAASLFESPQRFREALFFLRCLNRDASAALKLMRQRAYVSAAVAPARPYAELATNQAELLDATTFETLWHEPSRLDAMDDSIQAWRRAYQPVYAREHAEYNRHLTGVTGDIEATLWQADTLEKLNRLERLGEPVALPALARYHAIAEHTVCPADAVQVAADLAETPVCPYCGFRLGNVAPVEALNTALIAIERGLATQLGRLDRRVVRNLLARPGGAQGDRLERFIRVVQSADMLGLAQTLDEGLVEFLDDVLQTPEPRVNLIDRLARDYPEVTHERLDEVVEAFRALMQDELQRGGGRIVIGREDSDA